MNEIFKRVSVRKYEPRTVEAEKITQILKAAMAAPSAGNQQPWEFYVVTNRAKVKELSECSSHAGCAAGAPVVIVPCYRTEGLKFPDFATIDMANAVENMLLEIVSQGLGGVWLAVAPFEDRMKKAEEALGIEPGLRAYCLVALGYPAEGHEQQNRFDEGRIHYYG